ncbi:MAG: NifU family protein [Phycisphaerales bacterium]|nr:NifU family protein [Phycisphaerales bacterium]
MAESAAPDLTPEPSASVADRVRSVIERIRPAIQTHRGDIEFVRYEDGQAFVRLKGACTGCPHSLLTLKMGVERQLQALVPEVREVIAVD